MSIIAIARRFPNLFWCLLRVWFGFWSCQSWNWQRPSQDLLIVRERRLRLDIPMSLHRVRICCSDVYGQSPPYRVSCLRSCGFFCLTLGTWYILPPFPDSELQAVWLADASSGSWLGGQIAPPRCARLISCLVSASCRKEQSCPHVIWTTVILCIC